MEFWGYELILDCGDCDRDSVQSADNILAFTKELIEAIDMTAYGEPQLVHFGKHDPKLAGYTLVQLIETSSITGHFCDLSGDVYFNVHSCKPFDPDVAVGVVEKYFSPGRMASNFLKRQA